MSSAGSAPSTAEIDVYFEGSPVNSQFPSTATATQATNTPSQSLFSPPPPQAPTTVHPDVSHVEEAEIRNWAPGQVAHWLYIGGYDNSTIEKFLINDITGDVLLKLQIDDLKELDILSFGKRHQLMGSIDHLRETMLKPSQGRQEQPDSDYELSTSPSSRGRRSCKASVSPTGEVLSRPAFGPDGNQITDDEFVSIVGIEQLLPKPHKCSKGENCSKYQRRQRQLEKIKTENPGALTLPGGAILTGNPGNPETAKNMLRPHSDAQPSVVASSDIFGPAQETPQLCEEALSEVEKADPQERMRNFLKYQHVGSPVQEPEPLEEQYSPIPEQRSRSATAPAEPSQFLNPPTFQLPHMAANLRNLPKLTIPTDAESDGLATVTAQRTITPSRANIYGSPTAIQPYGPFSTAQNGMSTDHYRHNTPFSEMDAPITAIPNGPVARETSQSVPPDMCYGDLMARRAQEPVMRSASTRPQMSNPLRRVNEGRPLTPIEHPADLESIPHLPSRSVKSSSNSSLSSDPSVACSGYMNKRETGRFLRQHKWNKNHFTLRGTDLSMHKDEATAHRDSLALDKINVQNLAVAIQPPEHNSKLAAAIKRSVSRNSNKSNNDQPSFGFSLVPTSKGNKKKAMLTTIAANNNHNESNKSHHFSVNSGETRTDWVRNLMLARAVQEGRDGGSEMQVNGNFI